MGLGLTNLELKPITIISAVSIWYFISFFKKKLIIVLYWVWLFITVTSPCNNHIIQVYDII